MSAFFLRQLGPYGIRVFLWITTAQVSANVRSYGGRVDEADREGTEYRFVPTATRLQDASEVGRLTPVSLGNAGSVCSRPFFSANSSNGERFVSPWIWTLAIGSSQIRAAGLIAAKAACPKPGWVAIRSRIEILDRSIRQARLCRSCPT